jgi:hypothetical protein
MNQLTCAEVEQRLSLLLKSSVLVLAGILLNGCQNDTGTQRPDKQVVSADAARPKSMVIIGERVNNGSVSEDEHRFLCPANMIWTGRDHYGDETGQTYYFCSPAMQDEPVTVTVDSVWLGPYEEHKGDYVRCAADKVMTGREHRGDEEGNTYYQCGTPKAKFGNLQVVPDATWTHVGNETDSKFQCPANKVIVGRYHYGDEDGTSSTKYLCATLW